MHQIIATSQHISAFSHISKQPQQWTNLVHPLCLQQGMCAETIVKNSKQGVRMIDEADLMEHLRCSQGWHIIFGVHSFEDLFMMKLLLSPGSGTASTALPTWCWICCRRSFTPPMRPGRASWNCARRSTCRRSPSKLGRDVTVTCSRKQADLE